MWGAEKAYDDARALMADPDVDLVTVAVQLPSRDGLVAAAIAAGRHVYSEWPLARDAVTAERFESAARAAGVRHAVGLQSRHHPEVQLLREALAQGLIGEVLSASLLEQRGPGLHGPGPGDLHGRRLRAGLHHRRPGAPAAGRGQVLGRERSGAAGLSDWARGPA
ncbi:putative dehydrogenase [Streptomyces canus]|nr:putative dehydrogenase [Streptomyces canus]